MRAQPEIKIFQVTPLRGYYIKDEHFIQKGIWT